MLYKYSYQESVWTGINILLAVENLMKVLCLKTSNMLASRQQRGYENDQNLPIIQ